LPGSADYHHDANPELIQKPKKIKAGQSTLHLRGTASGRQKEIALQKRNFYPALAETDKGSRPNTWESQEYLALSGSGMGMSDAEFFGDSFSAGPAAASGSSGSTAPAGGGGATGRPATVDGSVGVSSA
jgi:hypothetical protein